MNGRKARALRKLVYDTESHRDRQYCTTTIHTKYVEIPVRPRMLNPDGTIRTAPYSYTTRTLKADKKRIMYQWLKKTV